VLLRLASPACHPCYPGSPPVGYGSFRQDKCSSLPLLTTGSATPSQVTRLRIGSLSLQPAGLLDSLSKPLSGNSTLRVTPCASLKLRGELPNSHGWTLTNKPDVIHGIRSGLVSCILFLKAQMIVDTVTLSLLTFGEDVP